MHPFNPKRLIPKKWFNCCKFIPINEKKEEQRIKINTAAPRPAAVVPAPP